MHDGHYINLWLYCKKTWLKVLKVKTGPIRDPCTGAQMRVTQWLVTALLSVRAHQHSSNTLRSVNIVLTDS